MEVKCHCASRAGTATQNSPFFPISGHNYRQYSLRLQRRDGQAEFIDISVTVTAFRVIPWMFHVDGLDVECVWPATVGLVLLVSIMRCCGNFRGSAAHGAATATKRTALKNFANSRIVSGLLKGNRLPDVRQLQKSMKLLKVVTDNVGLRWWWW